MKQFGQAVEEKEPVSLEPLGMMRSRGGVVPAEIQLMLRKFPWNALLKCHSIDSRGHEL